MVQLEKHRVGVVTFGSARETQCRYLVSMVQLSKCCYLVSKVQLEKHLSRCHYLVIMVQVVQLEKHRVGVVTLSAWSARETACVITLSSWFS